MRRLIVWIYFYLALSCRFEVFGSNARHLAYFPHHPLDDDDDDDDAYHTR